MAESLRRQSVDVRHKAGIGVVFDVASLNEVLHGKQWTALSLLKLYDIRLEEVHLHDIIGGAGQ